MKTKNISLIFLGAVVVGGAFLFFVNNNRSVSPKSLSISGQDQVGGREKKEDAGNVSVVDGKQIVEIRVKGGYQPRKTEAKAGVPTVVRFVTNGTFDCSSSVTIPSKKISKNLPSTGTTDIEIGTPDAGTLSGTCGMGMYSFVIAFS